MERSISTVADTSLALVLIVTAMGVLVTGTALDSNQHEPAQADHTAQTLAASTMTTTYTVTDAVDAYYQTYRPDSTPPADTEVLRVSHGPIPTQIADITVASARVEGHTLSVEANDYEQAVETKLETRLAGSQFDTSVSALWTPIPGSGIRGAVTLGQQPPPSADVSTTTLTVPSTLPDATTDALDAIDDADDYEAVATAIANATIRGQFPPLETQRTLERSGTDNLLTTARYSRLATALDGSTARLDANDWLSPSSANATAANAYLQRRLADEIAHRLRDGPRYETAREAAQAISTNYVTLTVKTWTDD